MESKHSEVPVEGEAPMRPSQDRAQRHSPAPEQLAALAEKIEAMRARREALLGSDQISEPGWEILVALYRADAALHRMTVSNACRASHSPASTALRWLDRLAELGLVRRQNNPLDGRVIFVELEPKAKLALHDYFSEIWVALYGTD